MAGDGRSHAVSQTEIAQHLSGERHILIAVTPEGRIFGTVTLARRHDDAEMADGDRRGSLEALEVDPDRRRQGWGRRLCMAVTDLAPSLGLTELTVAVEPENAAALALYAAAGYAPFKTSTRRRREHPVVCMRMSLAPPG